MYTVCNKLRKSKSRFYNEIFYGRKETIGCNCKYLMFNCKYMHITQLKYKLLKSRSRVLSNVNFINRFFFLWILF